MLFSEFLRLLGLFNPKGLAKSIGLMVTLAIASCIKFSFEVAGYNTGFGIGPVAGSLKG